MNPTLRRAASARCVRRRPIRLNGGAKRSQAGAVLAAALVLAFGTAACGDDDDRRGPSAAAGQARGLPQGQRQIARASCARRWARRVPCSLRRCRSSSRARTASASASSTAPARRSPTLRWPSTWRPLAAAAAEGPFLARYESLAVKAPVPQPLVAADPDAAKALYVSQVKFPKPGRYEVMGVARLDNRLVAATPAGAALRVARRRTGARRGRDGPADSHAHEGGRRRATSRRSTPVSRPRRCTRWTSPTSSERSP